MKKGHTLQARQDMQEAAFHAGLAIYKRKCGLCFMQLAMRSAASMRASHGLVMAYSASPHVIASYGSSVYDKLRGLC